MQYLHSTSVATGREYVAALPRGWHLGTEEDPEQEITREEFLRLSIGREPRYVLIDGQEFELFCVAETPLQ